MFYFLFHLSIHISIYTFNTILTRNTKINIFNIILKLNSKKQNLTIINNYCVRRIKNYFLIGYLYRIFTDITKIFLLLKIYQK